MRTAYLTKLVGSMERVFEHTKSERMLDLTIERAREALDACCGPADMRRDKIEDLAFLLETKVKLAIESG